MTTARDNTYAVNKGRITPTDSPEEPEAPPAEKEEKKPAKKKVSKKK